VNLVSSDLFFRRMPEIKKIPLFPLHLFLLPGERSELHIFEERYKELVRHCVSENEVFGIACNARENWKNFGSLVRISSILKHYEQGEMDVEIECIGLFRLKKFFYTVDERLWPGGYVEDWSNPLLPESEQLESVPHGSADSTDIYDLNLSLSDKLRFASIIDGSAQSEFVASRKRLLELLEEQEEACYNDLIYLN